MEQELTSRTINMKANMIKNYGVPLFQCDLIRSFCVAGLSVTSAALLPVAVSGSTGLSATTAFQSERPNILFIMSDDHGRNAVSCYGSILAKVMPTPNIDRIAREGMRLDNCFVTNSICSPSRAVILTGKYSHLNSQPINYIRFDSSQQTAPKLLQRVGYQTAIIGKWHLRGEPTGFDYWNILVGQGQYLDSEFMEMKLEPKVRKGYVTTVTTDLAIDWIENKRDTSKPFYLMLHHKAPHGPWEMDPTDKGLLDGVSIPEPETLYDNHKNRALLIAKRHGFYPSLANGMSKWKNTPMDLSGIKDRNDGIAKTYQHYLKHYLSCVHSIDENVGRVLACLEKAGILNKTLIIYTSDNGMFLGEHTWHDKRMMYEESLSIPMVVRYPKEIKPGSVSNAICLNLDFSETFLDYAGAPTPPDMQGESLRPIFKGTTPTDWRQSMFYAYYEAPQQYGVRTMRYKLICYDAVMQHDMFDLEKDPLEMKSVYCDPEYADVRKQLEAELVKLREKYNVTDKDLPAAWVDENPEIVERGQDKRGYD